MLMDPPAPCLPTSKFFHPVMGDISATKYPGFEGIFMVSYSLEIWESIFQVLKAKALQTPILSPEGAKVENGESQKPFDCTLPPT